MRFRSLLVLAIVGTICAIFSGCGGIATIPPTPARDVLLSGDKPSPGYGAYSYLLFTERPDSKNLDRYLAVQEAFVRHLEHVDKYSSTAASWIMPTYWLAEKGFDPNELDAKAWIDNYDYARAKIIAASVNALSSKGPLLVAWSKPFEEAPAGEKALVLDLADFSNEDLDRALRIWKDRITRDPKVWRDGLSLIVAKEAFRNFIEQKGDKILKAIEKVTGII